MKLLFENWQSYLSETREYIPKAIDLPDIGDMYQTISVEDIINEPDEDSSRKLALLGIFNQLEEEVDESNIKHILSSMRTMSGNSPEFDFISRDQALEFYRTPFKFKAHPKDKEKTKSLKDWHTFLKAIRSRDFSNRGEAIKDFYSSSDYETPRDPYEVDPYARTSKAIIPTIRAKEPVEEQTEPFQRAIKRKHKKMKIRLIGKGDNTYNVTGKMKKPSYERSKSAPAGAGGS
jgi:hypothetical protein